MCNYQKSSDEYSTKQGFEAFDPDRPSLDELADKGLIVRNLNGTYSPPEKSSIGNNISFSSNLVKKIIEEK